MKFRRRKYLVDTAFQTRLIFIFVSLSILGSCVTVATFNFLALNKLDDLLWSSHIRVQSTGEYLKPLFMQVNLFGSLFVSLLIVIAAIYMIRRAAGPISRMSRDIRKAGGGDLTAKIFLREKDDFKDVARELDTMVSGLRTRFSRVKEMYTPLSAELKDIGSIMKDSELESITARIDELGKEVDKFKIRM